MFATTTGAIMAVLQRVNKKPSLSRTSSISNPSTATPNPPTAAAQSSTIAMMAIPLMNTGPNPTKRDFEFFIRLPLELRLAIWDFCLHKPREPYLIHWQPGGGRQYPKIAAVNREARECALKGLTLCFDRKAMNGVYGLWINLNLDTVFGPGSMQDIMLNNKSTPYLKFILEHMNVAAGPDDWTMRYWTKNIRRLCINGESFGQWLNLRGLWSMLNDICPSLEELVILVSENPFRWVCLRELENLSEVAQHSQLRPDLVDGMEEIKMGLNNVQSDKHILQKLKVVFKTVRS